MTHLLASLLTGMTAGVPSGSQIKAEAGRELPEGPGFEKVLHEKTGVTRDPQKEPVQENQHDQGSPGDGKNTNETREAAGSTGKGSNHEGLGQGQPIGVTLLGGTFGARVRAPALTFMLPTGAGPEDMAAAIRTQVLRFTAARNLDPGSLDNLRIAISSRELGQVEVDLSARGDKLEVEIVASGRETEAVLRKTSGDLKEGILARADRYRQVDVKVSTRASQEEETPDRQPRQGSGRDTEQNQGQRPDQEAEYAQDMDPDPMEERS
jgi:hypothetical protein